MVLPKEFSLDNTVAQRKGFVVADVDGEKVMLSIEKGKYFGLNSMGSRIWEMLEKPITVREMVAALVIEYDVEEKTCRQDVQTFLNKLYTQELDELD